MRQDGNKRLSYIIQEAINGGRVNLLKSPGNDLVRQTIEYLSTSKTSITFQKRRRSEKLITFYRKTFWLPYCLSNKKFSFSSSRATTPLSHRKQSRRAIDDEKETGSVQLTNPSQVISRLNVYSQSQSVTCLYLFFLFS